MGEVVVEVVLGIDRQRVVQGPDRILGLLPGLGSLGGADDDVGDAVAFFYLRFWCFFF